MILANVDDHVGDGLEIWAAVEHQRIKPVSGGDNGRQFPVGEMGGEDQRRLAVVAQLLEPLGGARRIRDETPVFRVAFAQPIDMREFGGDTPEIVPDATQNCVNFGR